MRIWKGAGVLLKQGGQYLLQHRDDRPDIIAPGGYSVWGGKMEDRDNGSFKAAAVRELKEETGVEVTEDDLTLVVTYTLPVEESNKEMPIQAEVYEVIIDESTAVHCYEGQAVARFKSLSDIPKEKLTYPLRRIIERSQHEA